LWGTYSLLLDGKGRLVWPAAWGKPASLVLTWAPEKTLLVCLPEVWSELHAAHVGDDVFAACYATGAVPVPRDEGTGRILIPSSLRLHAGLVPGREVTWTGMQRAALVSAAAPGRVPVTALRAVGELLRRTAL
jgi:DNA-binding transcriptional regulator/RsmH inhibitor MraZ